MNMLVRLGVAMLLLGLLGSALTYMSVMQDGIVSGVEWQVSTRVLGRNLPLASAGAAFVALGLLVKLSAAIGRAKE